mgnify:CR=1 FL=1
MFYCKFVVRRRFAAATGNKDDGFIKEGELRRIQLGGARVDGQTRRLFLFNDLAELEVSVHFFLLRKGQRSWTGLPSQPRWARTLELNFRKVWNKLCMKSLKRPRPVRSRRVGPDWKNRVPK